MRSAQGRWRVVRTRFRARPLHHRHRLCPRTWIMKDRVTAGRGRPGARTRPHRIRDGAPGALLATRLGNRPQPTAGGGTSGEHLREMGTCARAGKAACTLALDGSGHPGAATPQDPRCVFCSEERFEQLTWVREGALVTHYLLMLQPQERREALRMIEIHGGPDTRIKFAERVARQERRVDPARAKRKPRGAYSKRQRAARVASGHAWGIKGGSAEKPASASMKREATRSTKAKSPKAKTEPRGDAEDSRPFASDVPTPEGDDREGGGNFDRC